MKKKVIDKALCDEFRAVHGPMSLMDAKIALIRADGDFGKALEIHRERMKRMLVNPKPDLGTL
jgi:translation elongation factor EF-Ts